MHEFDERNDAAIDEFEKYREFDSSKYRNFDDVAEFHNDYPEFPMEREGQSNSKDEEPDPIQEEASRHRVHISAAQTLATTFVALIVVSAILVPALDNKDVETYVEGSISDGMLYYMAKAYGGPEDEVYYAVVLQDGSIIGQTVMEGGFASGEVHIADSRSKYVVEVRAGEPPLLVLDRYEVSDFSSVWVDLDYLSVLTDSLEYGLTLHGGASVTLSVYDPEISSNVYSKIISSGYVSDIVTGLKPDHVYYFDVADYNDTYYFEVITTKA